jgi:thiamine biosynthesis lipoprotein
MTRAAAAPLLVPALLVGAAVCGTAPAAREHAALVSRDAFLMGTRAHLATYQPSRAGGLDTLDRALTILQAADAELSTWKADSLASRLNRQPVGVPLALSPAACRMFAQVDRLARDSGGTFDPAVGALASAWDVHGDGQVPDARSLADARALSGWSLLALDTTACQVTRRGGATIDTGGFGKGEAIDRVVAAGLPVPWLVDLGGQVGVAGVPPGTAGWTVSIAHPRARDQALFDVVLREGSLSTSGGSERDQRVAGVRVGHILDPRSGYPAPFDGSVVVYHRSALTADALSTALYVMGPEQGLPWAESRGIAACFLVPDGARARRVMTAAFERLPRRDPSEIR